MPYGIRNEVETIDYNGTGIWSASATQARYKAHADDLGIALRDISPAEHQERGRRWVSPVMEKVIEGIAANDLACIRIGIEFIESDEKFAFGKILKSNAARALRRAPLSEQQHHRIRRRVFGMLAAGNVPHEFREYAKLVRAIGFDRRHIPECNFSSERMKRFCRYFELAGKQDKGIA